MGDGSHGSFGVPGGAEGHLSGCQGAQACHAGYQHAPQHLLRIRGIENLEQIGLGEPIRGLFGLGRWRTVGSARQDGPHAAHLGRDALHGVQHDLLVVQQKDVAVPPHGLDDQRSFPFRALEPQAQDSLPGWLGHVAELGAANVLAEQEQQRGFAFNTATGFRSDQVCAGALGVG